MEKEVECYKKNVITVGENIIATTKIRNNYGAILDFSLLLPVKL